jgi:hypothetical protein
MPLPSPSRLVCCFALASALVAPMPVSAARTALVAEARSPAEAAPMRLAQKLPDTELPRPPGVPGGAPGARPAPPEEAATRRAGPAKKKDSAPASEKTPAEENKRKNERDK